MVAQFIPGTGASANAGDVNINVVGTTTNFNGGCGGYAAIVRFSNNTTSTMNLAPMPISTSIQWLQIKFW